MRPIGRWRSYEVLKAGMSDPCVTQQVTESLQNSEQGGKVTWIQG